MSYYSIYIPSKLNFEANDEPFVFLKKEEALKVLKNHKDARLKIFKNNDDAINYAQTGNEDITVKYENLKSPVNLDKINFHAPTKQQLIQFRKQIEEDNYDNVETLIWNNPRYLVNSADTPTSLKDGPRYNALHICAIHKKARVASLILKTISDFHFISFLHCLSNLEISKEVSDVLLDYYLNMPEKGRSETPLHLASKYGAVDVVEVLTSYPQCKMTPNLDNLLPRDIVCSRVDNPSIEVKQKILSLLEERFYVPVIRSVDNSIPPIIGEPFSPTDPPKLNIDPKSPELKIQAYAGPIRSKEEAQKFRRRWKTPPRNGVPSPITNSPYISPMKIYSNSNSSTPVKSFNNNVLFSTNGVSAKKNLNLNFEDTRNGNTKSDLMVNNEINNTVFPPLTPLLKNPMKKELFFTYRDQNASPVILNESDSSTPNKWEAFDNDLSTIETSGLTERHLKLTDTEKGFEIIGRELAKEHNIGWKEYWDFLDTFIDITSTEGLQQLEMYLAKKTKTVKYDTLYEDAAFLLRNSKFITTNNRYSTSSMVVNSGEEEQNFSDEQLNKTTTSTYQATNPYLCVEKSLQVFAKRMTKTILNNMDSVVSINDSFSSELKRLKSLVCSFRDDIHFLNIDFNVIHSRFANLIVIFLRHSPEINSSSLQKIKKCFQQIIQSRKKSLMNTGILSAEKKEDLQCISEMIIDYLENSNTISDIDKDKVNVLPENIQTDQMCSEIWREELKCNCGWTSSDTKRKRRFIRYDKKPLLQVLKPTVDNKNLELFRNLNSNDQDAHKTDDDEDDDETYWSDIGSNFDDDEENEKFYTPPESPTQLNTDSVVEDYSVFILQNEPTKRDWDVVKALHGIEINKDIYPNIYKWRSAVLSSSVKEYEGFQTPQKRSLNMDKAKRIFFQESSNFQAENCIHSNTTSFIIPTKENNYSIANEVVSNLSLLNISDL